MHVRFVITHRSDKVGLRRLTFAQQGRHTYGTQAEANAALDTFRGPQGLCRVLSPSEMGSLRVLPVDCYGDGAVEPGDPIRYYFDEDEVTPP